MGLSNLVIEGTLVKQKEYTSLKQGDVLHPGDTINSTTEYQYEDSSWLNPDYRPYTLVRANISQVDITESETGAYYLLKDKDGDLYGFQFGDRGYEGGYWPVTATSDGISVTSVVTGGELPVVTFAVHEATASPYADLVNTTTVVKFNDHDWYIIADDSTAVDAGTVTLLAKECVGASMYNESGSFVEYSNNPTVKTAVDDYYTKSFSADAQKAVSGNAMFLLTMDQANAITNAEVRMCSNATNGGWWLCSEGFTNRKAMTVKGDTGEVYDYGYNVNNLTYGVRPALQLDLSKVTFDSESNTFAVAESGPALDPVSYLAWDENAKALVEMTDACTDYTVVTGNTTAFETGKWYVVNDTVTNANRITVNGTANLILMDGKTLTASNGINVADGNTLNIYGQSEGTSAGALVATGVGGGAGIGGDNGKAGGIVNIHGGSINATGGVGGAGIGGGSFAGGGNVTITGGTVNTTGGGTAKGIGGGSGDQITNGTLTLGTGMYLYGGDSANPKTNIPQKDGDYERKQYMVVNNVKPLDPVSYLKWDETQQKLVEMTGDDACKEYTVVTDSTTFEDGKWYVVNSSTVSLDNINAGHNKNINLILCDDSALTVGNNIDISNGGSLTIYAGSTGETISGNGALTVNAQNNAVSADLGGAMTVNGGVVNQLSLYSAFNANGFLTVNGGSLTATSTGENQSAVSGDATVTVASGLTVKAGDDEGSATVIADLSSWTHGEPWVKIEKASVVEYPLWVGDVQVTSANAGDVLGNADEGATVSFTPATTGETPTPAL